MSVALAVMAKAPLAGQAKTRLMPALGPEGAARLASRMLQHTLAQALASGLGKVYLFGAPTGQHPAFGALDARVRRHDQATGDLGQRMTNVFEALRGQAPAVLLMGTDAPAMSAELLRQAAQAVQTHDAVAVPTLDGGYVLIGLKSPTPGALASLFTHMPWSTREVMAITRQRAAARGLKLAELPSLSDVDEPADLVSVPADWLAV